MGNKKPRVSLNVMNMKEGKWFSPDPVTYSELANCSTAQPGDKSEAEGHDEANMNNTKARTGLLLTEAERRTSP